MSEKQSGQKEREERTERVYIGFTKREKANIEKYREEYNFPTISEFIRQAVREKIQRLENPQLYQNISSAGYEELLNTMRQEQKLLVEQQKTIARKLDAIKNVSNGFEALNPILDGILEDNADLKKKRIEKLLKGYKKALKPNKISELTGFDIDTVINIISLYPHIFKTTKTGGIGLK